jgi:small GTP-binding protein
VSAKPRKEGKQLTAKKKATGDGLMHNNVCEAGELTVGVIGNPNSGKTTLFNSYTGTRLKVANWPGVTVEKKQGAFKYHNHIYKLVDLPGIYSLTPYSIEEKISRQFILSDEVDVIVDIADASNLERSLYLTMQLMEIGKPVVLALNMMDIVEERGMEIDLHRLHEVLGIPVIPVSARKKTGLDVLMHVVSHHQEIKTKNNHVVVYSDLIEDKIKKITERLREDNPDLYNPRFFAIKLLENDSDNALLKVYLSSKYGVYSPTKTKDAVLAVAAERAYHPIKEYLDSLPKWDGISRVENLLIDYFGAADNSYTKAIIRKTMVAAVARIYRPGTKFDSVLILNGPQGIGKSTFFAKLAGDWFSDSLTLTDMKDKSGAEKLQGYWLLELGELAGMRKTDVEIVKSFISRADDKYRASYGVNVESHPRQCVIVGSTNAESGFLRDITGNRRFWPVRISGNSRKKAWQMTKEEVQQIWAEALVLYEKGEKLYLEGDDVTMATSEQADAMETDEREGLVRTYLDTLLPDDWDTMSLYERRNFLGGSEFGGGTRVGTVKRTLVCNMEIWCECFGKEASMLKPSDSYAIGAIMRKISEWNKYTGNKNGVVTFPVYGKQRAYSRVEEQN